MRLKSWGLLLLATAGLASFTPNSSGAPAPRPRNLIVTGWDNPDTSQFRRDLAFMERWPFDGVILYAQGRGTNNEVFNSQPAFSSNHWEAASFAGALGDLQATHSARLTENFLIFGANPGNVDWFDNAGWKQICEHCRLLARLAKEGRLRGLLFDPENYTEPFKQFDYHRQAGHAEHSFADYCHQARQRGRETMAAIGSEFPDAVILSYFLLGQCGRFASTNDPYARLEAYSYGLLPAFANGWLDRLPPGMTLVDGNEGAYHYNSEAAFDTAFRRIKNTCLALVEPENRTKYQAQLGVGHGIYLDGYIYPTDSKYYIDPMGGTRVDRLGQNVTWALNAADRYVWIYGEHARWWPPAQPDATAPQTWPQALKGIEDALTGARNRAGAPGATR